MPKRDLDALAFIGEGYEVAQYQLHGAVFANRAPNVVSRFVRRASKRGLISVDRWNRIGINRIRLTPLGRDVVVSAGRRKDAELFAPVRPVAAKDAAHTLWINDVRVALLTLPCRPKHVVPAWALQRRLSPAPRAIPDILAIWTASEVCGSFVLACEIDLGGEALSSVFLPKLARLKELVEEWAGGAPSAILVLTRGVSRMVRIADATKAAGAIPVVIASQLPSPGSTAIAQLRDLLAEVFNRECDHSPEASASSAR